MSTPDRRVSPCVCARRGDVSRCEHAICHLNHIHALWKQSAASGSQSPLLIGGVRAATRHVVRPIENKDRVMASPRLKNHIQKSTWPRDQNHFRGNARPPPREWSSSHGVRQRFCLIAPLRHPQCSSLPCGSAGPHHVLARVELHYCVTDADAITFIRVFGEWIRQPRAHVVSQLPTTTQQHCPCSQKPELRHRVSEQVRPPSSPACPQPSWGTARSLLFSGWSKHGTAHTCTVRDEIWCSKRVVSTTLPSTLLSLYPFRASEDWCTSRNPVHTASHLLATSA